jgi:GntR family transcriptional regulator / MocR family aminotransferase
MAIQWSGLSPELLLRLDRGADLPLRVQLETGLRDAIRGGRLTGGERLPSSRELARELGVSRGLVQECYGQLIAEGYLTSQGGSATRVATGALAAADATARPEPAARAGAGAGTGAGTGARAGTGAGTGARAGTGAGIPARLIADFRPSVPDLASFPRSDWAWAMREACRAIATADLDYGDARGAGALRDVLAGYLRRVRAAAADPERIVVSTGFAQGLNLALQVLAGIGVRCAAFEDPGYTSAEIAETARAAGLEGIPVPVDEYGVDVAALAASGAQAVVLTPAHQAPTGVVLTASRRHAVLDWARRNDAYIIEDDYDSEFRYDREPVGMLQGLAPERVFTIGTASKSLAPAIRLGWVLAPAGLTEAVAECKRISDRGSATLDQLALAALLESGRYDRHLRRMRAVYAARRAVLIETLARQVPAVRLTGLAAGFHAVAHLDPAADERAVAAAALERQVGLHPMADFRATPAPPRTPQLILGFGNLPERAIATGLTAVADLLRSP